MGRLKIRYLGTTIANNNIMDISVELLKVHPHPTNVQNRLKSSMKVSSMFNRSIYG